jgi:thioredoxin-like negative regulator of GroEL
VLPSNGERNPESASAPSEAPEPGVEGARSPEEVEALARGLLERGQRERAVTLLRETAEAHPAARGLRRLLALTQARDSGFQGPIERQLLDLLEVDPHDNELRYALASYYRRAGMTARAILQLRIVLSADSAHAAAWRDLGELEAGPARRGR